MRFGAAVPSGSATAARPTRSDPSTATDVCTASDAGGPFTMRKISLLAALSAGVLLATGCSGPAESSSSAAESDENVIRFTFSPDPAWDWMQDQGILEEMEQESGYRILQ